MGNIYFEKDVNVYSMERGVFGHISKVCNKFDLFHEITKVLNYPFEFGNNWDALLDIYRDFSWIDDTDITIIHDDLSMLDENALRIYIEIVKESIILWQKYDDHNVAFIFNEKQKDVIMTIFNGYNPYYG